MALLDGNQIDAALAGLPGWTRDGDALACELECEDFMDAVALVGRIAELAESQGHHPDLLIHRYRWLRVTLSTHSEGGVTELDVALAREIEAL